MQIQLRSVDPLLENYGVMELVIHPDARAPIAPANLAPHSASPFVARRRVTPSRRARAKKTIDRHALFAPVRTLGAHRVVSTAA